MKKELLLLSDGTFSDAMAYAAICYVSQLDGLSNRVIFVNDKHHDKLREAFSPVTETVFFANVKTFIFDLEPYEMDQCDCRFATIYDVFKTLKRCVDTPTHIMCDIASDGALYLPSTLAYMLFRRLGFIDFANYIAEKLIKNPNWDITRDPDVVDILNPRLGGDAA